MDGSKHHGMTTYSALEEKEEKQKGRQERQMNDVQTSGVSEAEDTVCLPAEMRITRLHSRREEELPPPSSCEPV